MASAGQFSFDRPRGGVDVPFGSIYVKSGDYLPHTPDYPLAGESPYPCHIIKSGSDGELKPLWDKMTNEGNAINRENIGYGFASPNSNTVVTTLLEVAGLPQPKGNGLDGPTPAPGADMLLLDHHYSAALGYDDLAVNAAARGWRDVGHDLGAVLGEFHKALKAAAAKGKTTMGGMGLYDVALAAGRPGLGGFAPVAGTAKPPPGQKSRVAASMGEAGFAQGGLKGVQADAGRLTMRPDTGGESSYHAVLAQARSQVAASQARRATDRAALHLPARGAAGVGALSFAPPASGRAVDGVSLHAGMPGGAGAPGLRQRGSVSGSVHGAFAAAEAASAAPGALEAQDFTAAREAAAAQPVPFDIGRALDNYFFRQSRLPPIGAAGFNPLLSPVWAGLKIPG